jgi:hypothetical protein
MNFTLRTADRLTHLKIAVVSLIAGSIVVAIGLAARPTLPDMSTQLEARAPLLKAGKPAQWTSVDHVTIR